MKYGLPVPPAGALDGDLLQVVQELQRRGHVVAAAARAPDVGVATADLGIGVLGSNSEVPWGAHLIATGNPMDLLLVVHATAEARRVAAESVRIAAAGSGLGALLALARLPGPPATPLPTN